MVRRSGHLLRHQHKPSTRLLRHSRAGHQPKYAARARAGCQHSAGCQKSAGRQKSAGHQRYAARGRTKARAEAKDTKGRVQEQENRQFYSEKQEIRRHCCSEKPQEGRQEDQAK